MAVKLDLLRPGDSELDALGSGMRRNHPIIVEVALGAMVDEADTWIDVAIADPGIAWNAGAPLPTIGADEVVACARQVILADDRGMGVGAQESQVDEALRLKCRPDKRS